MTPSVEFDFTSTDGLRIRCARWDSRGAAKGIIQIAHGMGEHIGRYVETIDALTAMGLTVYGNDHRGHGLTAMPSGSFGEFGAGGFELLVEDVARLGHMARSENKGIPFVLLGHSMGSFAAQEIILDHSHEIDALILSGSGALDGLARIARLAPAGYDFFNDAFDPARTPFDWLSRDDAAVDAFIEDPLCFPRLRPQSFSSFFDAAPRLSSPPGLRKVRQDLPVYVFSGSDDPVGQQLEGVQALIERYREAGLTDISHDFYEGGRHEMLNEINRSEVRARLLRWLARVLERTSASSSVH